MVKGDQLPKVPERAPRAQNTKARLRLLMAHTIEQSAASKLDGPAILRRGAQLSRTCGFGDLQFWKLF